MSEDEDREIARGKNEAALVERLRSRIKDLVARGLKADESVERLKLAFGRLNMAGDSLQETIRREVEAFFP